MQEEPGKKINLTEVVCYLTVLSLVVTYKFLILRDFAFIYTDSDQTILWGTLKDYSKGVFKEPGFYGQAYNTAMEALFAVPLYKLGMPAYMALPIVSSLFSLMPFFIISLFTFLKRSTLVSLVILSIPLLLPIENGLITSMPRGFVPGLFVAGFGCIAVFFKNNKWWLFAAGLLAVLAYIANSSSVLISAPYMLYLLLVNFKNKVFYLYSFLGLLLGSIILFSFNRFYTLHPNNVVHTLHLDYSFKLLAKSFKNLDVYFNFNAPFFHKSGFLLLFIFLILAVVFLYQKKRTNALVALFVVVLVIATLGLNKVHQGYDSIFFHYSRMYLSLPVTLAFCLSLFETSKNPRFYFVWLIVPLKFFIDIYGTYQQVIERRTRVTDREAVIVTKVEYVIKECREVNILLKENKAELFIILHHYYYDPYDYGCAACIADFPNTLRPIFERRTWRLLEDENRVYQNIMIADLSRDFAKEYPYIKKINHFLYLLENNQLPTQGVLDSLKIECRNYK